MVKIAPSILSANFAKLGDEVKEMEQLGADVIHLDVMDGHYVPNITFGADVVKAIRPYSTLPFDVHLMVDNPESHISSFAAAGADYITIHWERATHIHKLIQEIHSYGVKAGVSLNPGTPVSVLEDVAGDIDLLLIMSVNPGFGGQTFISHSVEKIKKAKELLSLARNEKAIIEVDGGINKDTAERVVEAGASLLVAGSAIFNAPDRKLAIEELRN